MESQCKCAWQEARGKLKRESYESLKKLKTCPKMHLCLSAVECLENKHLYFASRLGDAMKVNL